MELPPIENYSFNFILLKLNIYGKLSRITIYYINSKKLRENQARNSFKFKILKKYVQKLDKYTS